MEDSGSVGKRRTSVSEGDDGIVVGGRDGGGVAAALTVRPPIAARLRFEKYKAYQLVELAEWILSDTLLRTDDELMLETQKDLGFNRGSKRVDAAIRSAIPVARTGG